MKKADFDLYKLPANVLFFIGLYDIVRGIAHTFLLPWSAVTFAKLDLAATGDQIFLLGLFGVSNFLTGFLFLLISRKARELSPYVLGLIPGSYLLGLIGIWSNHIYRQAAFNGRYMMFVYFGICLVTLCIFLIQKHQLSKH